MAGSHDQAMLMVELSKWGAMIGLPEAARTVLADDFEPDAVEADDPSVQVVLMFFETVGTLVKNGLLDRELVHDWLWVAGHWRPVAPAALRERARWGVPELHENFEALAAGQA